MVLVNRADEIQTAGRPSIYVLHSTCGGLPSADRLILRLSPKIKSSSKIIMKGYVKLHEQKVLRDKFVAFTSDWGLKSNYIATTLGFSLGVLYQFRCGKTTLTKTQAKKLEIFMTDYEQKNKIY